MPSYACLVVGLLLGLAAGLWAAKYLLIPALVLGVGVWAVRGYMRTCCEIDALDVEIDAEVASISARADRQHQQVMRGDPEGIYGVAWPVQRLFDEGIDQRH